MRNLPSHLVVLLMDVPIEDGDVVPLAQDVDGSCTVFCHPVPSGVQVEEWPVREHYDLHIRGGTGQVGGEPLELCIAQNPARLGDVVERDEMDPFMIELVPRLAERLAVRIAAIKRGVMLTGDEANILDLERGHDFLETRHPGASLSGVVGRVREVSGKDDEVWLQIDRVDRGHGVL